MLIQNCGFLTSNKTFDETAVQLIADSLESDADELDLYPGGKDIEFDGFYACDLEDLIKVMITKLAPLGYVFNGEISYYGDWDGKIYVHDNQIDVRSIENTGLYEASDALLIQMLRDRGYIVTNKEA